VGNWIEGIQTAIGFIEEHILEELPIEDIAARAYVSPFHFQRIFSVLCGFSVGEYIRNRRLALAAEELCTSDMRVLDAALKYGYDSHESFTRAFKRFHGVDPSHARKKGALLRAFGPLRLKLTLEGGSMLEYRIVEKTAFEIVGVARRFSAETSHMDIPAFWDEHRAGPWGAHISGAYGVCLDGNGGDFEYLIADYWQPGAPLPEGCVTRRIPGGTWAVFPVRGKLPEALQDVNRRIWNEWLPNSANFRLAGSYDVEWYSSDDNDYSEIWIPVERI